jgi:hypothetical protein
MSTNLTLPITTFLLTVFRITHVKLPRFRIQHFLYKSQCASVPSRTSPRLCLPEIFKIKEEEQRKLDIITRTEENYNFASFNA